MSFSFHPETEEEFSRAVEFPKSWSVIEGGIRRSMVTRFPYGVLYNRGGKGKSIFWLSCICIVSRLLGAQEVREA
ncbi:hypothetical protein GMJAKD_16740 [Candidatus Electrothrix aarhusensis]